MASLGRPAGLSIALLLALMPMSALAQSICHGRSLCRIGPWRAAGHDAAGAALRVARVVVPGVEADEARCPREHEEYWLRRGAEPPRLLGDTCMASEHTEGVAVTIGDNRLTTEFMDHSGCCSGSFEASYQLHPLRVVRATSCYRSRVDVPAGDAREQWTSTRLDRTSLQGESLSNTGLLAEAAEEGSADSCTLRGATRRWLPIVRLGPATPPIGTGDSLGSCSTVMGSGHGYLRNGRQTGFEVRMLAPAPRSLIIQVVDRSGGADSTPSLALGQRSHLELWVSNQSRFNMTAEDDLRLSGMRLDAATGRVEQLSGPDLHPRVTHWQVRRGDGTTAALVRLDFPAPAEDEQLIIPPTLTVLYRHVDGRTQSASVASSLFTAPRLSRLGETYDVSRFTRCSVRDHALDVTRPGFLDTPFEAQDGGGMVE